MNPVLCLEKERRKPRARSRRFPGWIKFLVSPLLLAAGLHAADLPPELVAALKDFRADGPKGWSFTQTTEAGTESLVEHFDATGPEFDRWTLLRKDGRAPTPGELQTYHEGKTRRSSGATAPRLQDQLDLATATLVRTVNERSVWRFQMAPGGFDDRTAHFMAVTLTFHQPSRTIEQVEIASTGSFSPVIGVKIAGTRTRMDYSLPTADHPSLLLLVALQVRGRAFWLKSLDQDMTVTYSDHHSAFKK